MNNAATTAAGYTIGNLLAAAVAAVVDGDHHHPKTNDDNDVTDAMTTSDSNVTAGRISTSAATTASQSATTSAAGDVQTERDLALNLFRYAVPVIVLLGTVGNALSFAVLVRKSMRSTPMYFYLTLLAVADTVVLYTSAFKTWIRLVAGYEALHVSDFVCRLLTYLLLDALYLSAWLIVLVTVDRFLVVWFPFRGYLMMRIRQARAIAACLVVLVGLSNAHVFWTFELHRPGDGSAPQCQYLDDNFFMRHVFESLKLVSYCVIPFAIVAALNVAIAVKINRAFAPTQVVKCGVYQSPMNAAGAAAAHHQISHHHHPQLLQQQQHLHHQAHSALSTPLHAVPNPGCYELETICNSNSFRQSPHPLAHQLQRHYHYSHQQLQQYEHQHNTTAASALTLSAGMSRSASTSTTNTVSTTTASVVTTVSTTTRMQDIQRKRQRRLTRMLMFISISWLALTAPFTINSFLQEVSLSSSRSSASSSSSAAAGSTPVGNDSSSKSFVDDAADDGRSRPADVSSTSQPRAQITASLFDRASVSSSLAARSSSSSSSSSSQFDDDRFVSDTAAAQTFADVSSVESTSPSPRPADESARLTTSSSAGLSSSPLGRQQSTSSEVESADAAAAAASLAAKQRSSARSFLVKAVCFILIYANHASNFYLYCVTGRKFRQELVAMTISCWRWCRRTARRFGSGGYGDVKSAAAVLMTNGAAPDDAMSPQRVDGYGAEVGGGVDGGVAVDGSSGGVGVDGALKPARSSSSGSSRTRTVTVTMTPSKKVARPDLNDLYN